MAQTILLPYDGSPGAERAVELVAGYQGSRAALEALVVNMQSPPVALWPEAGAGAAAIEEALLEQGSELAQRAAARLTAAGVRAQGATRLGFPADGILREAERSGAAIIVMGTRGHGVLQGFALGSVALRVAHGGAVPVCLVQPQSRLPAALGRSLRVLLATDGSEPALRAAQALHAWQGWLGALDVQIAYVQPALTLAEQILPPHRDVIEQWSTRAGEEATRAARTLFAGAGIKHHVHYSVGDAAAEIVHLAGQAGCELIALGTRGRGAAHHAFVGSVALKVAAQSAVPVLLAK